METIGDKYMAVSGLPEPCRCHARCIARLALDMMDLAADEVQIDGEPVVRMYEWSAFTNYILLQRYGTLVRGEWLDKVMVHGYKRER